MRNINNTDIRLRILDLYQTYRDKELELHHSIRHVVSRAFKNKMFSIMLPIRSQLENHI